MPDSLGESRGQRRIMAVLIGFAVVLVAAVMLRLMVRGWPTQDTLHIMLGIRLSRVGSCLIVGVALAVSGVALQVLLRNPLAEPFILGLSTGAGVGIFAAHLFFATLALSHIGALLGATASMAIVYLASRRHGVLDPLGLLLTGVVLGTVNGALIMLLNYVTGPAGIRNELSLWMMGYIDESVPLLSTVIVAVLTALGLALLLGRSRAMDVAAFSDVEAESLGVNLTQLRTVLFLVAGVLAAGAVVLAGPIAFVGLISPHLTRLVIGPRHGTLLIGSAMLGATLLLLADSAAVGFGEQFNVGNMPLGIFTAMLGGPIFIWMLRPKLGRAGE